MCDAFDMNPDSFDDVGSSDVDSDFESDISDDFDLSDFGADIEPLDFDDVDSLDMDEDIESLDVDDIKPLDMDEGIESLDVDDIEPLDIDEDIESLDVDDIEPLDIDENIESLDVDDIEPLDIDENIESLDVDDIEPLDMDEGIESLDVDDIEPLDMDEDIESLDVDNELNDAQEDLEEFGDIPSDENDDYPDALENTNEYIDSTEDENIAEVSDNDYEDVLTDATLEQNINNELENVLNEYEEQVTKPGEIPTYIDDEISEYGARVKGLTYDGRDMHSSTIEDIVDETPDYFDGSDYEFEDTLNGYEEQISNLGNIPEYSDADAQEAASDIYEGFSGELSEQDYDTIYEGLDEYDFHGIDCFEDTERLDANLENFTTENWENLSLDEQKEQMTDLAQYIIDVTGLKDPPKIEFYDSGIDGDYGGFNRATNTLSINEHMLYQNDEAADTIAHELWHAYQYERASNPSTKLDYMYLENFNDYITPDDDFEGYQSQILESEARAFAQQIKDRLHSY